MSLTNFVSYANAHDLMARLGQELRALNGAYVIKGNCTFANLPASPTVDMNGYVYNVTDDFTTDARFIEGAGKKYSANTNVVIRDDSTYAEVTPVGSENPTTEGWYEIDSETGKYVLSQDTTVDSTKTYYTKTVSVHFDVISTFVDVEGIEQKIQDVSDMITGEFDETLAYSIGDVVVYEGDLYKFKAAHTANDPWDATEVDATTVIELIQSAEPSELTTQQVNALLALI